MPELESLIKLKRRILPNNIFSVSETTKDFPLFVEGEKAGLCQQILPPNKNRGNSAHYITNGVEYTTIFLKFTENPVELVGVKGTDTSNEEDIKRLISSFCDFIFKWGYSCNFENKKVAELKTLWKQLEKFHHPFSIPTELVSEFKNELDGIFSGQKRLKPEIIEMKIKIFTAVCPICSAKTVATNKGLTECSNCGEEYAS